MAKHKDSRLKLPGDFLGTVKALLGTPPPPKKDRAKAIRKAAKSGAKARVRREFIDQARAVLIAPGPATTQA